MASDKGAWRDKCGFMLDFETANEADPKDEAGDQDRQIPIGIL